MTKNIRKIFYVEVREGTSTKQVENWMLDYINKYKKEYNERI